MTLNWTKDYPLTPGVALTILRERTSGPLDRHPDRYHFIRGYVATILEEVRTVRDCQMIAKALGVTKPANQRQKIANQIARHTTGAFTKGRRNYAVALATQ